MAAFKINAFKSFTKKYPLNIKKFKFVFLWQNRNIIHVTEQNIVTLKTVSLNSSVVAKCPFYRTTDSILLEISLFTGIL